MFATFVYFTEDHMIFDKTDYSFILLAIIMIKWTQRRSLFS